jgi:hypothetical protein
VKYPDLPLAIKPVPQSEELPVPKPPENPIFSDDNCDSDEDHRQLEGNNVECDPTFAASCSSSEPRLLTQGNIDNFVCDFNLSKKQAKLLGSRLKKVKSSPPRY